MPMQTVRIGSPSLAPCQLMLDILQTIGTGAQPKEAGTAPGRAGDGPRDGGEACVGRFAPDIAVFNDRDGVPLALVFAQERGAGLEAPGAIRSRLVAPCETVEMLCGLRIKSTPGLLLDVPAFDPLKDFSEMAREELRTF
jgi:hypothetical protein